MVLPSPLRILSCLCLSLLLIPTDGFEGLESITLRSDNLNDIITASIISAVLGDLHERNKERQEEEEESEASAQQHQPFFMPFPWQPHPPPPHHHPLQRHPLPLHPLQHPSIPALHHQHQMMVPMMHHHLPRFQPPGPQMPMVHPQVAQWIHQQISAHFQQLYQQQMIARHHGFHGIHGLPTFDTLEQLHSWQHQIQSPAPVFQSINFS